MASIATCGALRGVIRPTTTSRNGAVDQRGIGGVAGPRTPLGTSRSRRRTYGAAAAVIANVVRLLTIVALASSSWAPSPRRTHMGSWASASWTWQRLGSPAQRAAISHHGRVTVLT